MKQAAFIFFIFLQADLIFGQNNALLKFEPNPEKVLMYTPYFAARHGGPEGLEQFKKSNIHEYMGQLWYFTESFYLKPNVQSEGVTMNASAIDITRYEQYRKPDEDFVLILPGFKDALVLLATNKLIYKPVF